MHATDVYQRCGGLTMKLFNNKQKDNNTEMLQKRMLEMTETIHLYSEYQYIIEEILSAKANEMSFIPTSDFMVRLEKPVLIPNITDEQNEIVKRMKASINILLDELGYTEKDQNGFNVDIDKIEENNEM